MRYKLSENIILAGKLPAGINVTINVLQLQNDEFMLLDSEVCIESDKVPGLYMWSTSNIKDTIDNYSNMYYEMTDGENVISGKFVMGGYIEATENKLIEIRAVVDGTSTTVNSVDSKTTNIESTVVPLSSEIETARTSVISRVAKVAEDVLLHEV